MTHSERFQALFRGGPVDRVPLYYFGTWPETKQRWRSEGFTGDMDMGVDAGPQLPGMDPDWEAGMWECHALALPGPIGDFESEVLEQNDRYVVRRDSLGQVVRENREGSSIPHVLKHALEPTRDSWERFKRFIDPEDPRRRPPGWEGKAEAFGAGGTVKAFLGGSLYGWLRNWMGLEAISYLQYDDPALFDGMVGYLAEYFLELNTPMLKRARFDFAYVFEDCCGANGPLFSPAVYRKHLDQRYRAMIERYRACGVPLALVDSDGKTDALAPCWLESGFDILFPIEVGAWGASVSALRSRLGPGVCAMGGVDKHVIPRGEAAIREHLSGMKGEVDRGGFLPMPDHRIPPDCSLEDFRTYIRVFNEVFNS